jgi:mRNA interferase MazF
MQRGELYLVRKPGSPVTRGTDPKKQRAFVVVSRQLLIDSKFSTAICAPVYSRHDGLSTQVAVGIEEGLRHESSIHCDELLRNTRKFWPPNRGWTGGFLHCLAPRPAALALVSLPKTMLSSYVGGSACRSWKN